MAPRPRLKVQALGMPASQPCFTEALARCRTHSAVFGRAARAEDPDTPSQTGAAADEQVFQGDSRLQVWAAARTVGGQIQA